MSKDYNALISILTINDNTNYGNRLQNFALDRLLRAYGTTTTMRMPVGVSSFYSYWIAPLFNSIKLFVKFILSFVSPSKEILEFRRIYECYRFTKKYIPDNKYLVTEYSGLVPRTHLPISCVVLGSDQVWNYRWLSKNDLALRLCSFLSNSVPVISYAASFGISDISDDIKPIFQKYLPRLKAISVREDRGAELVKELIGLDAAVVLDPTLMLSTNQWDTITRGFIPEGDKYVLTYFLGKPSAEQEQTIQKFAKSHNYRIRRILDLRDRETFVAGPQDFVELFSKTQYVFTDSYHACCFSILYHKQFTVFNRAGTEGKASMNSRMETLFRLFDLNSVVMDKGMAPYIEYDVVDKLLSIHRAESQAWLDKAMEA